MLAFAFAFAFALVVVAMPVVCPMATAQTSERAPRAAGDYADIGEEVQIARYRI